MLFWTGFILIAEGLHQRLNIPRRKATLAEASYDYSSSENWGADPGHGRCKGNKQSPVNLVQGAVNYVGTDSFESLATYQSPGGGADWWFENMGQTIRVGTEEDQGFGSVTLPGKSVDDPDVEYIATHFDFHFPGEHSFNGKTYGGEVHIHHHSVYAPTTEDGGQTQFDLLIVAVPLEIYEGLEGIDGVTMPELFSQFVPYTSLLTPADGKTGFELGDEVQSLMTLFGHSLTGNFFRYDGSLTMPPCKETVKWIVAQTPTPIRKGLAHEFNVTFGATARPVQPLNGRKVVMNSGNICEGS